MAAGHGSSEPKMSTRQRLIDVFRAFKQGELTNAQAGRVLADMQVETGLEDR